jgi:hypothetical protein
LIAAVRRAAASSERSVNAWIAAILTAAVDPDLATDEAERLRERLRRAGLLAEPKTPARRPNANDVKRARRAAGRGTPLSKLVSEGRR